MDELMLFALKSLQMLLNVTKGTNFQKSLHMIALAYHFIRYEFTYIMIIDF